MEFERAVVPPVAFELSDAEATSALALPAKQRQLLLGLFAANIAIGIINAVLGVIRPSHADPFLSSGALVVIPLFGLMIVGLSRNGKPRKQRAWSVSFDDAGMHLASKTGPPRAVPWRTIRSVHDTGTAMVLNYGILRSVIIPRRAYTDNGDGLWLLLQRQLIGPRSLHRRADARIIINSAAR